MHLFSRKTLALSILTLLILSCTFFLNSGSSAYASTTHGTSVKSASAHTAMPISPHLQNDQSYGCPSGAVCIYPQNVGWNNGHPSDMFWSYGAHNLSNMFGVHRLYNNQTGGATTRTCTGYNGSGCEGYLPAGWYIDKDFTPINSITLEP